MGGAGWYCIKGASGGMCGCASGGTTKYAIGWMDATGDGIGE